VNSLTTAALVGTCVLGGTAAAVSQPLADITRTQRAASNPLVFAPNGPTLRAASLDQEEPLADLLWIRAVLVFGERWRTDLDPTWIVWLRGTVLAATDLDPPWRSPYFYGGSLLRVLGDIDGSDEVFKRGADNVPSDGYFAFSYAMNQYLYHEDPAAAADWLDRAAREPGAARWYSAAAGAMRSHGGDREGAIAYLEGRQREELSDPERADVDIQLARLYHDRLAATFAPACAGYEQQYGEPPPSAAAFFAFAGTAVPVNPRGDDWVVGGDGCVRSRGAEATRLLRLRKAEMKLVK